MIVACSMASCGSRVRERRGAMICQRTLDHALATIASFAGDQIMEALAAAHDGAVTAQLALRPRKAGISRTFSSIELRTGEERPYGSRRCGAAWRAYSEIGGFVGRASGWRAVGRSCGLANCGGGALRSIRSAVRRLSLRSLPASSVSELSAGCLWRAGPRLSMPVATTETRTIPSRLSSKDAPTMMLAS